MWRNRQTRWIQVPVAEVGGQAVLGRQYSFATPWLTERHGYDPTYLLDTNYL